MTIMCALTVCRQCKGCKKHDEQEHRHHAVATHIESFVTTIFKGEGNRVGQEWVRRASPGGDIYIGRKLYAQHRFFFANAPGYVFH